MNTSWCRRFSDVSLLRCRIIDNGEHERTVVRRSPSQTGKGNVHSGSKGDNDETLTLLRSDVAAQVLRKLLGYNPKQEDGGYVEETITSNARIDSWVATTVSYVREKEKRGGYRQKEYADVNSVIIEAVTGQVIGTVQELVKHWSWHNVGVEGDELSSSGRREVVVMMSRTTNNVWTLPSVSRKFISVNKEWFQMYVTDALCSVQDYYFGRFQDKDHVSVLGVPTDCNE